MINSTKLLGTIITSDLRWEKNTENLVQKSNSRMEILRKIASFGASKEDMKNIYFLFVRSQLEQSAVVWHSSLTNENRADLERVQKTAVRIIMGNEYKGYRKSLLELDIETLDERREKLCLNFAKRCLKNEKARKMFPMNHKDHAMKIRNNEIFKVQFANTESLQKSAQIYMQKLLKKDNK